MTPPRKGGKAGIRAAIENAEAASPTAGAWRGTEVPGFEMRAGAGLFRETQAREGKGATTFFVAGCFEVLARTRDGDGNKHGLLLAWTDADGLEKELIIPKAWLFGEARELRARLADMGLSLAHHAPGVTALVEFLSRQMPVKKVRTVPRPGWYRADRGAAFVLPKQSIGHVPGEEVRLDMDPLPASIRSRGVQARWRDGIAAMARGNSLLMFVIAAAVASPLAEALAAADHEARKI